MSSSWCCWLNHIWENETQQYTMHHVANSCYTMSMIAVAFALRPFRSVCRWLIESGSKQLGKDFLLPLRGSKVDVDDRSIAVMGMSDGASLALSMVPWRWKIRTSLLGFSQKSFLFFRGLWGLDVIFRAIYHLLWEGPQAFGFATLPSYHFSFTPPSSKLYAWDEMIWHVSSSSLFANHFEADFTIGGKESTFEALRNPRVFTTAWLEDKGRDWCRRSRKTGRRSLAS